MHTCIQTYKICQSICFHFGQVARLNLIEFHHLFQFKGITPRWLENASAAPTLTQRLVSISVVCPRPFAEFEAYCISCVSSVAIGPLHFR